MSYISDAGSLYVPYISTILMISSGVEEESPTDRFYQYILPKVVFRKHCGKLTLSLPSIIVEYRRLYIVLDSSCPAMVCLTLRHICKCEWVLHEDSGFLPIDWKLDKLSKEFPRGFHHTVLPGTPFTSRITVNFTWCTVHRSSHTRNCYHMLPYTYYFDWTSLNISILL